MAPSKDFPAMERVLMEQFMHGYLDADLQHVLETAVPPGDLAAIGSFRRPTGPLLSLLFGDCC